MSRGFSRRHFLQATGATLAALGWSQLEVMRQGDRYGRAWAQSTPRKLALLVGINDYPLESQFAPLNGCVNDVELQYHLLVHRFGFNPADIVKLTDAQATRDGLLTAFEEHLIKQAKPGDVVVFHPPHEPEKNYVKRLVGVPGDSCGTEVAPGTLSRSATMASKLVLRSAPGAFIESTRPATC